MQEYGDPVLDGATQVDRYYLDDLFDDWFISECKMSLIKQREYEAYLRECEEVYFDDIE